MPTAAKQQKQQTTNLLASELQARINAVKQATVERDAAIAALNRHEEAVQELLTFLCERTDELKQFGHLAWFAAMIKDGKKVEIDLREYGAPYKVTVKVAAWKATKQNPISVEIKDL